MKVIIAGTRSFNDYQALEKYCDSVLVDYHIIEVVSGCNPGIPKQGLRGADLLGEDYAKERGFKIQPFKPDWDRFGLKAGPIRNQEMASYAHALIAFWDGKSSGTKDMIDKAKKKGLKIRVYDYVKQKTILKV